MPEITHEELNSMCDNDVYSFLSDLDDDPIMELIDSGSVTIKVNGKEIIISLKIETVSS